MAPRRRAVRYLAGCLESAVGGEHFDDLGVVSRRIACNALQGIDPAEADIQLRVAELVDSQSEALSDLACLIEAVGQAGEDGARDSNQTRECRKQRCTDTADFCGLVFSIETLLGQPLRQPLEKSGQVAQGRG